MAKIHVLNSEVANQIAAGEVVERPSSVVKELVENSQDAGATQIDVEIEDSGKRLIQVTDNGCGMNREDLELCVARHATSKIEKADDLWGISTFGFRGEALPSIASVSVLSISSRATGSPVAYRLRVEGGRGLPLEEDNLAQGTRVSVRNIFYNTPARLKFLKAASTENARLQAVVTDLALAHNKVGFRLKNERSLVLDFAKTASLGERVAQVLGGSFLEQSLESQEQQGDLKISGWIGRPHTHRSNRSGQHFFVNGRAVEHRLLNFVLSQAYGNLLPQGRYAMAVLYLQLPAQAVDVNVHPAKREVRFRDENQVMDFIRRSVAKVLSQSKLTVGISLPEAAPALPSFKPTAFQVADSGSRVAHPEAKPEGTAELFKTSVVTAAKAPHQVGSTFEMPSAAKQMPQGWPVPLAQLHKTYLLCQSAEGLVLVDQHAAHERVLYEKYLLQLKNNQLQSQSLLLPQKLSLGPSQAARLREWLPYLQELGLEISDMGVELFYVVSVPAFLKGVQVAPLVQDLLHDVQEEVDSDPAGPFRQEIAARMACRAAIKAGDELTLDEMQNLIQKLSACELPWACPHGRPPLVSLSLSELEKYFQRK